jgi:hypothetical protein
MGKIFEKITAQRIAISGLHYGAVCNTQMGGRAQNSAIDELLRILDRIGRDISKRINYSTKKPPTQLSSPMIFRGPPIIPTLIYLLKSCLNGKCHNILSSWPSRLHLVEPFYSVSMVLESHPNSLRLDYPKDHLLLQSSS